jgi:hypothetical protein
MPTKDAIMSSIEYHVAGNHGLHSVGLTHDPEGRKEALSEEQKARWKAFHALSLLEAQEIEEHCISRGMTRGPREVLSEETRVYVYVL